MAKNILMKQYNGDNWVEIHPITKASNVFDKDGKNLEFSRTYTLTHSKNGKIHTLSNIPKLEGLFNTQFVAISDFIEGDTFTDGENVYTGKPTGEETVLPEKAFVKGDIVSVLVDTVNKKLGFDVSTQIKNTISTYKYSKSGGIHILSGRGNNIQFIPTSNFNEGDHITVNGTSVIPVDNLGEIITGDLFKAGIIQNCTLQGNKLVFKLGSGGSGGQAGLNIFCQTSTPKADNGIWIKENIKPKKIEMLTSRIGTGGSWNIDYPSPPKDTRTNAYGWNGFGAGGYEDKLYFMDSEGFYGNKTGKEYSNYRIYNYDFKNRQFDVIMDSNYEADKDNKYISLDKYPTGMCAMPNNQFAFTSWSWGNYDSWGFYVYEYDSSTKKAYSKGSKTGSTRHQTQRRYKYPTLCGNSVYVSSERRSKNDNYYSLIKYDIQGRVFSDDIAGTSDAAHYPSAMCSDGEVLYYISGGNCNIYDPMTNLRSVMMTGRPDCSTMQFYGGKLFCFGTYLSIIDVSSKLATSESRSFAKGNDASAVANGNIFYFNFTSDTMVEYQTGKTFDNGTLVISENLNRNVVNISKNKNVTLQVGVNNIIYYENNSSREVSAAYKNKNSDWVSIK